MKRTTLITYALLAAGLGFGAAGCKDFVNLTPQDVIPVQNFYKTESDLRGALTGTYGSLRSLYNTYYAFTELPSDNARTFGESEAAWGQFDKLTWVSTNVNISSNWNDSYRTIANANILLERIDAVPFSSQPSAAANDALKAQYKAEAKFLRALMYFNLVRFYGDVPLVLTEIKTEAQAAEYSRNPVADVYAQIEKDLLDAEAVLPATFTGTNIGRATSTAARALLGKAYLQQKKWPEAEAKLAPVVALYPALPTLPAPAPAGSVDYSKLFGLGNDNNAEIIFAVQYQANGAGEGNSFVHNFAPQGSVGIVSVNGGSTSVGTYDLFNAFETGDVRKAVFITQYNATAYYYAKKFIYNISQLNEGDNDWPVLRYADAVLMYAEALNNNGKTALALPQINRIRTRAGLPVLALTLTAPQTQLAIEQERRVELCFEGHRWHDLIRWGKAESTLQAFKTKYGTTTTTPGYDAANSTILIDARRQLFPIPDRETKLNSKIIQNFPGYY